jgi:hypothetical protein
LSDPQKKYVYPYTHLFEPNNHLVQLEALKKLIECTILSTLIKDEKPISLLIVALPESGKTTAMQLYKDTKGVLYLTEGTAFGIQTNYLRDIESGKIRTFIIPDLITPLAKQQATRQGFIAFFNSLIEEGVAKVATGFMLRNEAKEVKANMITAVTKGVLEDNRHHWDRIGFMSRFIVISYSYDDATIQRIMKYYSEHGYGNKGKPKKIKFKVPAREIDVDLPVEIAEKLTPVAMKIGKIYSNYGIRAKVNFRCLLKCIAWLNRRTVVNEDDFDEFLHLARFMNLEYHPI